MSLWFTSENFFWPINNAIEGPDVETPEENTILIEPPLSPFEEDDQEIVIVGQDEDPCVPSSGFFRPWSNGIEHPDVERPEENRILVYLPVLPYDEEDEEIDVVGLDDED